MSENEQVQSPLARSMQRRAALREGFPADASQADATADLRSFRQEDERVRSDDELLRGQHDEFYGHQPAPLSEVTAALHGEDEAGRVPSYDELRAEVEHLHSVLEAVKRTEPADHIRQLEVERDASWQANELLRAEVEGLQSALLNTAAALAERAAERDSARDALRKHLAGQLLPADAYPWLDGEDEELPADHPRCPQCGEPLLNEGRVCLTHGWLDETPPASTPPATDTEPTAPGSLGEQRGERLVWQQAPGTHTRWT